MAAIWTPRRPEPAEALVRVAQPVAARTWLAAGHLANFLRGKGACLVPWTCPDLTISSGATDVFRFRVKPKNSTVERIWGLILRTGASSGVSAEIRAPQATGTLVTVPVSGSLDARTPLVYTEVLGAKSKTEQEITIGIKALGGSVIVEGIACMAQDRPILNMDATDLGVDVVSLASGQPILEEDYRSLGGVINTLNGADARRIGLFHWTIGDLTAATRSANTYAALLPLAVPVLARKLGRAAVTGSVKWSAYAKVDAGAGGQIRVTTTESGVDDVMTVTGTSYAWQQPRTISIDCDDMDSADGRQTSASPAWDDLQIQIKGDGTNALRVKSVSIWSDD